MANTSTGTHDHQNSLDAVEFEVVIEKTTFDSGGISTSYGFIADQRAGQGAHRAQKKVEVS